MTNSRKSIIGSSVVPFRFVFFMWLVYAVDISLGLGLTIFGIQPREQFGLIGIATSPLLHGSFSHLLSNTFPLLFLGSVLFFFYSRVANAVFIKCYLFTNILVWLVARDHTNHIGASGLVYGIAFFLISFGLFRRDVLSLLISVVIIFTYGGLVYGVLPNQPGVSWESHLFGAVVGVVVAITTSKKAKVS